MKCKICLKNFFILNKYIMHLQFVHNIVNRFECPIDECGRLYNQKTSFKKHMHYKHNICRSSRVLQENTDLTHNVANNNCESLELNSKSNHSLSDCILDQEIHTSNKENEIDMKGIINILQENYRKLHLVINDLVLQFISCIYDAPINRSVIQTIVDAVDELLSNDMVNIIKESCTYLFKNSEDTTGLQMIHDMLDLISNCFNNVKTEYKRTKVFEMSNMLIRPIEHIVGVTETQQRKNNKVMMVLRNNYSYFIPMRHTFKLFLEMPNVFNSIMTYQKKMMNLKKDVMCNIVNGNFWNVRNNNSSQVTLPITLYFDDFEILNPLGSHAGLYKIGAVYYSIPTIPPAYASKLDNLFLSLIFYSDDRIKFGNKSIFNIIIDELIFLAETGIFIKLESGEMVNVKFCLVAIIGDNAGLNSILGFTESFSATYFCRICCSSRDMMRIEAWENETYIRNSEDYNLHLANKIGIKEESVWNKLPNFHVYNNVYCDIMHDLFEGVHRYDMALIINSLIKKKYFTLKTLNSRIKYFTYRSNEKNIPPGILEQHLKNGLIILSASEMLCLVNNFRFIVGELIPENEEIWELYLLLYEITEVLTCPVLTTRTLEHLKNLITQHNTLYLKLSGSHLKPKFHFLTHYIRVAVNLGPPVLLSCLRYEAKHQEYKNIAQSTKCRKNLPYTLAFRSQLTQCYRFMSGKGFIDNVRVGFTSDIKEKDNFPESDIELTNFYCTSFYEKNNMKYEKHVILPFSYNNDQPMFCKITDVFLHKLDHKLVYFLCELYHSDAFNSHIQAFKVTPLNIKKIIPLSDIENERPSILHYIQGDIYASL